MHRSLTTLAGAGTALLLALGVAGPVAAQSPDPAASAAPGASGAPVLSRVLVPSAGFTIELPADWLVLEIGDDPDAVEAFSAAHPELADHVARFLAMGPTNMLAMPAPTADDPFPPTFGAFKGINMGLTAEAMRSLTLQGLPQVGVTGDVQSELLTISGQPGYAFHYDWTLPGGDGTPVHIDQYTVVTDGAVWAFSVTDDASAPDAWADVLDSFQLLP